LKKRTAFFPVQPPFFGSPKLAWTVWPENDVHIINEAGGPVMCFMAEHCRAFPRPFVLKRFWKKWVYFFSNTTAGRLSHFHDLSLFHFPPPPSRTFFPRLLVTQQVLGKSDTGLNGSYCFFLGDCPRPSFFALLLIGAVILSLDLKRATGSPSADCHTRRYPFPFVDNEV